MTSDEDTKENGTGIFSRTRYKGNTEDLTKNTDKLIEYDPAVYDLVPDSQAKLTDGPRVSTMKHTRQW